jgi:hypothetical protein
MELESSSLRAARDHLICLDYGFTMIFPRACPSSTYRMASGVALKE